MAVNDSSEAFAGLIRKADRILVFTGAGISTGSGIPDFRGPDGVWKTRQPVYYQDFMRSETSRIEHWDYKLSAWNAFRDAVPNAAHRAVAALERANRLLLVVTQNIDGLHSAAGTSPDRLVEIHGTNRLAECQSCGARSDPQPHFDFFERERTPPLCACSGFLKPATISFGQPLRKEELRRAGDAALGADLVIALGTTLTVNPASSIPLLAADRGVPYVIVNRGATDHDGLPAVTLRIEGDVTALFPPVVQMALGQHSGVKPDQ
jgi:NAD-dependent deacetylase